MTVAEDFGPVIGTCKGCEGEAFFGHCTIAINADGWETFTPSLATLDRRNQVWHDVRKGELQVLCMECAIRMQHLGWTPPGSVPVVLTDADDGTANNHSEINALWLEAAEND